MPTECGAEPGIVNQSFDAKGVRKFQPRAAPWVKQTTSTCLYPKGVRNSFNILANTFGVFT